MTLFKDFGRGSIQLICWDNFNWPYLIIIHQPPSDSYIAFVTLLYYSEDDPRMNICVFTLHLRNFFRVCYRQMFFSCQGISNTDASRISVNIPPPGQYLHQAPGRHMHQAERRDILHFTLCPVGFGIPNISVVISGFPNVIQRFSQLLPPSPPSHERMVGLHNYGQREEVISSVTQYSQYPDFIVSDNISPWLSAFPATFQDEHTIISTNGNTRLALQRFIDNPVLLTQIHRWVHGGYFCSSARTTSFASRPLHRYQIARFLSNFESPIITVLISDKTALACCDTGCAGLLLSFGYFRHLFPKHKLNTYCGLPYRQASGDPLPIKGQFEANLTIGNLSTPATVVVMEGNENFREFLVGWKFIKSNNISCCPDGLYVFPSDITDGQASPDSSGQHQKARMSKLTGELDFPPPSLRNPTPSPPLVGGEGTRQ